MSEPLTLLRGGRVIDPAAGRDAVGDVCVRGGHVAADFTPAERARARILDVSGRLVCPGFLDLNCRLREPGATAKENVETGTRAAAAGGFTTVLAMPDTNPPIDTPGMVQALLDIAAREALVRVLPVGCLTVGGKGEKLAPIGSLHRAGAVAITDSPRSVAQSDLFRHALEYARMFGVVAIEPCQDAALAADGVAHEGHWSLRLGLKGLPRVAEEVAAYRAIALAEHTGMRVHLQGVSSAGTVEILRRAKGRRVPVTADVGVAHLALTEAALEGYSTACKLLPPLRAEADRQALIDALADGTIDALASGHAPHTADDKDCEFDFAPFGAAMLETLWPVAWAALVETGRVPVTRLVEALAVRPATLLGRPPGTLAAGAPADLTVIDPDLPWTPSRATLRGRGLGSPWLGQPLRGRPVLTLCAGRTVWDGAGHPQRFTQPLEGAAG